MKKHITGYPSIDKPWLNYYTDKMINTPIPECSIYEFLYNNNKDYPQQIAINYFGREITFAELFKNIETTTAALIELGVREGDIVTVGLPSIPEALYLVYAINRIGAVSNMIHPLAGEQELAFYLNEVKSRFAFLFDATYRIVVTSLDKTSVTRSVISTAGESLPRGLKQMIFLKNKKIPLHDEAKTLRWQDFLKMSKGVNVPEYKKDPNTMALISHTGGTTGEPKGVMCSDNNINYEIMQMGLMLDMRRQETQMAVLPPFVNYSLINSMLEPLALGQKCVLIPKYEPDKFFEYAKKYRPNIIATIPPYLEAMLTAKERHNADLSFIRLSAYGGEAMDPQNEAAINELYKQCKVANKLGKGIGMTELMGASTFTMPGYDMGENSLGIPLQHSNCKIIDTETHKELGYNQEGEICFAGPCVMLGYYHNKKATEELVRVHDDGVRWIHTGDLGKLDENGRLYITGRIKRIIMTKGKDGVVTKLFPDRIEKVVNTHPAVSLSCVISVPDEVRVNYPKAYVELKPHVSGTEQLSDEIKKYCHNFLPGYMIPEEVEFIDELPRTSRGKVDFRALEKLRDENSK